MSRHHQQRSYGHRLSRIGHDCYRISWVVDRYYEGSRLRFPTSYRLITGEEGARRFAKKWDCAFPEEPAEA